MYNWYILIKIKDKTTPQSPFFYKWLDCFLLYWGLNQSFPHTRQVLNYKITAPDLSLFLF